MLIQYSPVVLESIDPEKFPDIPLYVNQGKSYALYKSTEMKLTGRDINRLRNSNVEYVYVRGDDVKDVQVYLESNLGNILTDGQLSAASKNAVMAPLLLNCISSVFMDPEQPENYHKCRFMLYQLAFEMTNREELSDLLAKIALHQSYLVTHSAQVAILAMFLHKMLFSVDQDELVDVGVGCMLHDLGMLYVSGDILEKTDPLNRLEYMRIRHHPQQGHDLMLKMGVTEPITLTIALSHHEWYNGAGYPHHLCGDDIPRSALITTICDVYCALTAERPYRKASSPDEALRTMQGEKRIFHPEIFTEFSALMGTRK
jgi:HD-GYP domain-containing protein (c-di-GMP phosphodiesterase class II)